MHLSRVLPLFSASEAYSSHTRNTEEGNIKAQQSDAISKDKLKILCMKEELRECMETFQDSLAEILY
jgi:hypothetical protein